MRHIVTVAVLCAACGKEAPQPTTPAPEPTPQAKLRDDVRRRVEAALPGVTFTAKDDLTLTGKRADGTEQEIRIDHLWHEVEGAKPEEREDMIARFVKMAIAGPAPAPGADRETKLKAIMPLVRSEAYLEEMRKMGPPASRPLVADLHVIYAYDGDAGVTVVPLAELKPLALTPEELDRRAAENLNALIGSQVQLHTIGRYYMLTCGGRYESSLLVADKLWKNIAENVKGDIVAGCPSGDLLLFTDGADPAGVAALRKAVDKAFAEGGRAISKRLLRRTATGWAPYDE